MLNNYATRGTRQLPSRRLYNTVIERQSELPLIGMDSSCAITAIESLHLEYGLTLPQSLILLQASARFIQMPLQTFIFRKMTNVDSYFYKSSVFKHLIQYDLQRDLPKLELKQSLDSWKTYYAASRLLSATLTSYT